MKTSFGEVAVSGRVEQGKPLLFVIRGAFPESGQLLSLSERFPELSVAVVNLPGMRSPYFENDRIDDFAAAYDEMLALFDEPACVVGLSIGGVAGLAMESSKIRSRVAVDTPLETAKLWPIVDLYRMRAAKDARVAQWIDALFGISADAVENRDYRPLVKAGTRVLVGSEPLGEPRSIERFPSLVSEADRAAYKAAGATLHPVPGAGHNIPLDGWPHFWGALKFIRSELLGSTSGPSVGKA